jgi:hypothetical protein
MPGNARSRIGPGETEPAPNCRTWRRRGPQQVKADVSGRGLEAARAGGLRMTRTADPFSAFDCAKISPGFLVLFGATPAATARFVSGPTLTPSGCLLAHKCNASSLSYSGTVVFSVGHMADAQTDSAELGADARTDRMSRHPCWRRPDGRGKGRRPGSPFCREDGRRRERSRGPPPRGDAAPHVPIPIPAARPSTFAYRGQDRACARSKQSVAKHSVT